MKTVELSAALGQAQVVENLKNFVGVDAQGAAALMTPERLAAVAGGLLPVADENRNGLMQATYAKTFRIGKRITADTGNKIVKICSITGDGEGLTALCFLRSVYSAGESTLLSINAAYGGGKEYVTINAFNVSTSYKKGMFKKKSIIGGGFDLYVVLDLNVTFDIFYTSKESVPLILTESKDEGLIEI